MSRRSVPEHIHLQPNTSSSTADDSQIGCRRTRDARSDASPLSTFIPNLFTRLKNPGVALFWCLRPPHAYRRPPQGPTGPSFAAFPVEPQCGWTVQMDSAVEHQEHQWNKEKPRSHQQQHLPPFHFNIRKTAAAHFLVFSFSREKSLQIIKRTFKST